MVLVLVGWVALLRGLYSSPASDDPALDLDAGSSFAVNVDVYLPALALTAMLVLAMPVTLAVRAGSVVGVIAALATGGFAIWTFSHHDLLAYLPGLSDALWLTGGLSIAAVLLLVLEAGIAAARSEDARDPSPSA